MTEASVRETGPGSERSIRQTSQASPASFAGVPQLRLTTTKSPQKNHHHFLPNPPPPPAAAFTLPDDPLRGGYCYYYYHLFYPQCHDRNRLWRRPRRQLLLRRLARPRSPLPFLQAVSLTLLQASPPAHPHLRPAGLHPARLAPAERQSQQHGSRLCRRQSAHAPLVLGLRQRQHLVGHPREL